MLDFIERHSLDAWPIQSLTPVVRPGDPDLRATMARFICRIVITMAE
jgi:hypothetical protein